MDDPLISHAKADAGAPATLAEIRTGSYYDSVVLMQLQRSLAELPGVLDAGVVMGTPANKELLTQNALLTDDVERAAPEDLILIVRAESAQVGRAALGRVDDLLAARRSQQKDAYQPKSLASAARMIPEAEWALISLPGRHAAAVARDALNLGKNVFLYSDNVSLEDEISLKESAAGKGLLVMGPDCGTARVDGVGLGFANRVRRGGIGIVAASGTGLQAIMVGIHRLGGGISQAFGTGGRDLSAEVQARSTKQALAILKDDPQTDGIVIVSKPPAAQVAKGLLSEASACNKPVVVNFIGYQPADDEEEGFPCIRFARTLDEAAASCSRIDHFRRLDWHHGATTLVPAINRPAFAVRPGPTAAFLSAGALLRRDSGLRSALPLAGLDILCSLQRTVARGSAFGKPSPQSGPHGRRFGRGCLYDRAVASHARQ